MCSDAHSITLKSLHVKQVPCIKKYEYVLGKRLITILTMSSNTQPLNIHSGLQAMTKLV